MQKLEEYYVALWCLLMPVTSLLVIPDVQGTIPAYLLAFGSVFFILLRVQHNAIPRSVQGYAASLLGIGLLWGLFFIGSQVADLLHPNLSLNGVMTISDDNSLVLRKSLFTQSLYLIACVLIALYFRYFFQEKWMRYVLWGAWFLTIYGLYDWAFFLVFKQSGDFLANRTFAEGDHPGSWSQTIDFAGMQLLRLKSTMGEPSYYSAVVIPYLFLALERRKIFLSLLLIVTALLSTSTAVYLGMASSFFIQAFWSKKGRGASMFALAILLLGLASMFVLYPDTFRSLFTDKFSGENVSGKGRIDNMNSFLDVLGNFTVLQWIFGVGFGYTYFTVPWAQAVNTGAVGLGILFYFFLKPAWLLPRSEGYGALKISMLAFIILFLLTLSELFIPTTWMFLGLAYRKLDELKARRPVPTTPPLTPEALKVA